jgi:hypothetical protein
MNSIFVNTHPKEYITVNVAKSVEMRVFYFIIGSSIEVNCSLKDENGNVFKIENIAISGDEYNNWGSDDSYLINLVLSKLGLSPTVL